MDRFIFWGLFAILGLIVLGYTLWMFWIEGKENNQDNIIDTEGHGLKL